MPTDTNTAPRCPYFGECGGCQHQDWTYERQLQEKAAMLAELYERHWTQPIPVAPSPVQWNYRNKVDPAFAPKQYEEPPPKDFVRETVLGFKKKGRWFHPLDIDECHIGPEGMGELLASMREWYRAEDLRAFDNRRGGGFLRNLLIRDAKRTGEKMVVLLTAPGDLDQQKFVDAVLRAYPADSIHWGVNDRPAEVATADETTLLHGKETITARMRIPDPEAPLDLSFRVSPFSFFQTNTLATEILYGQIRSWVKEIAPENLYDLYGGSGGIAFSCADLVEQVWSVEEVAAASQDGRHNANENNIGNVLFLTEDVKAYVRHKERDEGFAPNSVLILDPPRAGIHPKALRRIAAFGPQDLIYVSCNPKILTRELDVLKETYTLTHLEAVDLFPHTRHVEVLARLTRTK